VATISEHANAVDWTCEIQMLDGRLPDLTAIAKHIADMRVGATLRGVEVTLVGTLVEKSDEIFFRDANSGEMLRLLPLAHKVQWDVASDCELPMTEEEGASFVRLREQLHGRSRTSDWVQMVGPVVDGRPASGNGQSLAMQVREFSWLQDTGSWKDISEGKE